MIDHRLCLLALRARLSALSVATTGTTTLAATIDGYTRNTGSFLDDGFARGMEIVPAGFTETTPAIISSVSALAIKTTAPRVAEANGAGRSLSVGLPVLRDWENVGEDPIVGRWLVEEDYIPGPAVRVTDSGLFQLEGDPMYVIKYYGLPKVGIDALYALAQETLRLFLPDYALNLSNGDTLRVRSDPAPFRGQVLHDDKGRAYVTVTVPLRIRTVINTLD